MTFVPTDLLFNETIDGFISHSIEIFLKKLSNADLLLDPHLHYKLRNGENIGRVQSTLGDWQ